MSEGNPLQPKAPPQKTQQPFDFNYIKVIIKRSSEKDTKEVYLQRSWVQKNNTIPHFSNVIKGVSDAEGVEITMNCNYEAFNWIISFVRIKTDYLDEIEALRNSPDGLSKAHKSAIDNDLEGKYGTKMDEINCDNCLNVLVTCYFLQLSWVYDMVWEEYFKHNFAIIINSCKISLSNINPVVVKDIAIKIKDLQLEELEERKDKFISNVYKTRIDHLIIANGVKLYYCEACGRVMTKEQAFKISCEVDLPTESEILSIKSTDVTSNEEAAETPLDDFFIDSNGKLFKFHNIVFRENIVQGSTKDSLLSSFSLKESQPINIEQFIKFFREKHRLCWKEIYLKVLSIQYEAEQCKRCRCWFQLSDIGCCQYEGKQAFHEIDFDEKMTLRYNTFGEKQCKMLIE